MSEKIDVLIVSPCSAPRKAQIENTLEAKQAVVGGHIEVVHPFADAHVVMVVNEEGKLLGLEPNRAVTYPNGIKDIVVGSFLICRDAGEHFASLTPQQMEQYSAMFQSPEVLVRLGDDFHMMNPYALGEKTYQLYQVKPGEAYRDFHFVGLEELGRTGQAVDAQNYDFVYSGPLRGRNLDELYQTFNVDLPADYRGRSMSVSDVVVISDGKAETAHYVDRAGFTSLGKFAAAERPPTPPKPKRRKPPKKKGGDAR